jgi:hypothetical protein
MEIWRIRARIAQIAASPKNVDFDEIANLLDKHIGPLYANYNHHGNPHHAFTLSDQTFNIAKPHSGCVKLVYVKNFLIAMEALGLYDPNTEESPGGAEVK